MRLFLALLLLCAAVGAQQPPMINEFVHDDEGADDREFVELYHFHSVPIDLTGWTLSNEDVGGTAFGSPFTFPAGTVMQPQAFLVIGASGVPNVDFVRPNGFLENGAESIVLRDPSGAVRRVVGYQTRLGPVPFAEGAGIVPTFTSYNTVQPNGAPGTSWSRPIDGASIGSFIRQGLDFIVLPATPGERNRVANLPNTQCDDFDLRPNGVRAAQWSGTRRRPRIVDPTIASPYNPSAVPPSPAGGNALAVHHSAGFGNLAFQDNTRCIGNRYVEAWIYFHTGETGSDYHAWSFGIGTSDSDYAVPELSSSNGNVGVAWRYYSEGPNGPAGTGGSSTLRLVVEGDGTPGAETVIGTIDIIPGVNDGWQHLRLDWFNLEVTGNFQGAFGSLTAGTVLNLPSTFPYVVFGTPFVGSAASFANPADHRPLLLDRVEIGVRGVPCSVQWETNDPASTLEVDAVVGGPYTPAKISKTPGAFSTVRLASTGVGLPFEVGISRDPTIPFYGGGIRTPGFQYVNLDLAQPSVPIVFLLGGPVPNLTTTAFPAPVITGTFNAQPVPGFISGQMVNLDPGHVDGASLSQAVEIEVQ